MKSEILASSLTLIFLTSFGCNTVWAAKGGLPAETEARQAADEDLQIQIDNIELQSGGVAANQLCDVGYVIGFDADGNIICSTPSKVVFVTSTSHNGALGGVVGADRICNTLAAEAGLPGLFKAWISAETSSPISTFNHSADQYVLVDGTIIADNWADLTDGLLSHPINMDELQNSDIYKSVWTNTKSDGSTYVQESPNDDCNGWTTSLGSAHLGETGDDLTPWTDSQDDRCNNPWRLYCFEQ